MRRRISLLAALAALALVVVFPAEAAAAARNGLEVCAGLIVPSLFPFFVLSGLLSALGLPAALGRALEKPMRALFSLSGQCAAPFILGLTGGYPVGAAAAAELVRRGALTRGEAERLLPFCNNTGPAFIVGAVGSGVFGSAAVGLGLYASHAAAAAVVGLLLSPRGGGALSAPLPPSPPEKFAAALTQSVRAAVGTTLNVCGFAVFFSVVIGLAECLDLFSQAAGRLAVATGCELSFARAALYGIFELGNGVAAMRGLAAAPLNLALASFVLGFGSLSVHCQTAAVTASVNIKCARHFAGRILHGLISALITFVFALMLRQS
ncbi:MAG: sporulation protein [Oscillospiraceae bacterium]|nr:sporulation protein [Oscillospiraceae bacterium]